tara:strand:+ start:89 stop:361 length:273 start_codon:yes stop_codon:yes gene_type:complete
MDKDTRKMELCVKFGKGKEHLKGLIKITEMVMTQYPEMVCNLTFCCDPDDPDKVSGNCEEDFKKDKVVELLNDLLSGEVWKAWEDSLKLN